jgi:hypothetical protein
LQGGRNTFYSVALSCLDRPIISRSRGPEVFFHPRGGKCSLLGRPMISRSGGPKTFLQRERRYCKRNLENGSRPIVVGLGEQRRYCKGKGVPAKGSKIFPVALSSSIFCKGVPAKGKAFLQRETLFPRSPYHLTHGNVKGVPAKGTLKKVSGPKAFLQREKIFLSSPRGGRSATAQVSLGNDWPDPQ